MAGETCYGEGNQASLQYQLPRLGRSLVNFGTEMTELRWTQLPRHHVLTKALQRQANGFKLSNELHHPELTPSSTVGQPTALRWQEPRSVSV